MAIAPALSGDIIIMSLLSGDIIMMSLFLAWFVRAVMYLLIGGTRGVMIIVVGNEHGDTSSNPGRD